VRRRLALAWLAFAVVVLVVLEVPLAIQLADQERRNAVAAVEREAATLAIVAEEAAEADDPERLAPIVRRNDDEEKVVLVVDASGAARPGTDTALAADLAGPLRAARAGRPTSGRASVGGRSRFFAATAIGGELDRHGALAVLHDTRSVDDRVRAVRAGLAAIALVTLLLAGIAGLLLARSVTRPLERLRRATARLGRGDLAARAEIDGGPPEIVNLGSTFDGMAEQIEELVSSQRSFVADASHQLRTPLTALRLRLEAIDDPGIDPAIEETDRLTELVDALLALARADGRRPDRRDADVGAIVRERLATWAPLAAERHVRLDATTTDAVALVAPGDLAQILDNVIDNALDVSPPGGAVSVTVTDERDVVRITVRDEGPGLPPDLLERAFDRFWRLDAGRAGNGLGLAIVRQLAVGNGGGADLRPAPGGGIEARVWLPAAAGRSTSAEERAHEVREDGHRGQRSDDEQPARER
jgi:signal transduction histidine kinase